MTIEVTQQKNTLEVTTSPNTIEIPITTNTVDLTSTTNEITVDNTIAILEVGNLVENVIEVNNDSISIISVAEQGPRGVPEDEVAFAKRVDFTTNNTIIYKGEAIPGTGDADALWRVRRLTLAGDDDVTEEWADGVADFTKVWNDRLSFTYS